MGAQGARRVAGACFRAPGDRVNNGTHPLELSGGGAARRRAPPSGDVGQLHRRGRPGRSTFTADYFRIHVSDRIGITSNFESPQMRVGSVGASSMPPQQRNSIEINAPGEWKP